jgi:hypothetical protein
VAVGRPSPNVSGRNVFISYARADKVIAARLATAIADKGWPVWWDHDLLVGTNYRAAIEDELRTAGAVVVAWSTRSVQSDFVLDEAQKGKNRDVLVPVRVDDVELPMGYGQIHTFDLRGWTGAASGGDLDKVFEAITRLVGPPPDKPPPSMSVRSRGTAGGIVAVAVVIIAIVIWAASGRSHSGATADSSTPTESAARSTGLTTLPNTTATPHVTGATTGATAAGHVTRTCGRDGHGDCFLSIRLEPSSKSSEIARLPEGATLDIECQVEGESVRSSVLGLSSDVWDRTSDGRYVAAVFVDAPGFDPTRVSVACDH